MTCLPIPGPRLDHRDKFLAELADAAEAEPRLHLLLLARDDTADLISAKLREGGAIRSRRADPPSARSRRWPGRPRAPDGHSPTEPPRSSSRTCRPVASWSPTGPSGTCTATRSSPRFSRPSARGCGTRCHRHRAHDDAGCAPVRGRRQGAGRATAARSSPRSPMTSTGRWRGSATGCSAPSSPSSARAGWRTRASRRRRACRTRSRGRSRTGTCCRWRSGPVRAGIELLADRLIQPLRDTADELPPAADPAEYLAAAERALAQGELDVAQRYAGRGAAPFAPKPTCGCTRRPSPCSAISRPSAARPQRRRPRPRAITGPPPGSSRRCAIPPRWPASWPPSGRCSSLQQRPEDALEELRAAIDRMPGDPVIQTDLALALWRLGESEAAVTVLTAVLALDGGNTVALRARGEILADLGEARQAMLDLDRVTLEKGPPLVPPAGSRWPSSAISPRGHWKSMTPSPRRPGTAPYSCTPRGPKRSTATTTPRKSWPGARSTLMIPGFRPITGKSRFSSPRTSTAIPKAS